MITIKGTDTQKETYRSRMMRGISLVAVLLAATAGTAMTGVLVDQTKIKVTAKLYRGADQKPFEIYNEQIRYANAISTFGRPQFLFFQNSTKEVLLANTGGVTEKAVLPMFLDFGKTYNLRGQDCIEITINTTGCFSDATVSSTTSYLELTSVDSQEGVDDAETVIEAYNIQTGKTSDGWNLGDGITDIMLYNSDKTDILEASAPFTNATVASDQFNAGNQTFGQLLGKRLGMFLTKAESDLRYHSFVLYQGDSLTNVRLDLNLAGANVNASSCYVIVRRKVRTAATLVRGEQELAAKSVKRFKQAGMHSEASKLASIAGLSR